MVKEKKSPPNRETSQQAQENIAILEELENRMLNLDLSPEGVGKSIAYMDNVMKLLGSYQSLLNEFYVEHQKVASKRKKFGDKRNSIQAQICLAGMNMLFFTENQNFSLKVVQSDPPGSFLLKNRLVEIMDLTDTLLTDYANFCNLKDPAGLEKSKKSLGEISIHLNESWTEIERLNSQITDLGEKLKKSEQKSYKNNE